MKYVYFFKIIFRIILNMMTKRVNVILCLTSELFTCHLIARNSLQVFTAADLQEKGKAGYQAVFNTLMQLALKAQGIFEQKVVFFIDSFTFFFLIR